MSKKQKTKSPSIQKIMGQSFKKAGYTVEKGAFDDGSASWLLISKKEDPEIKLELGFDSKGNFEDFNVWKDIFDVVDSEKIV